MTKGKQHFMQIFALTAVCRSGGKRPDGSYEAFRRELGVFSTVEKAEAFMKLIIEREKKWAAFHGFYLFEKTLDRGLAARFGIVCEFESVRSYRADGTPDCVSFCDAACEKPFRGRPAETIRLEIGDIAWYWWDDRIVPCVVTGLPLTDVRYRELARKLGRDLGMDGIDDSYLVCIAGWGHEHPACWQCTPYYGTISKRTLRRLDAARREEEAARAN